MLENELVINGYKVIYTVFVRGGRLMLAASEREYVTGWLDPEAEGVRREWKHGNYRRSAADIVVNFMTRYRDANGADAQKVLNEVREALSDWQKGAGK